MWYSQLARWKERKKEKEMLEENRVNTVDTSGLNQKTKRELAAVRYLNIARR